jgi:hypothetical protein
MAIPLPLIRTGRVTVEDRLVGAGVLVPQHSKPVPGVGESTEDVTYC